MVVPDRANHCDSKARSVVLSSDLRNQLKRDPVGTAKRGNWAGSDGNTKGPRD